MVHGVCGAPWQIKNVGHRAGQYFIIIHVGHCARQNLGHRAWWKLVHGSPPLDRIDETNSPHHCHPFCSNADSSANTAQHKGKHAP
jgi:hypothetical protein